MKQNPAVQVDFNDLKTKTAKDVDGNIYDVAIIGGGLGGISAAYGIAGTPQTDDPESKKMNSVVLFNAAPFGAQNGGSGGPLRMFRTMYDDTMNAQLTESAYAMWHQLQEYSGYTIIPQADLIFYGNEKVDGESFEGQLPNCRHTMQSLSIPFTELNASQIEKQYEMIQDLPEDYIGLQQRDSSNLQSVVGLYAMAEKAIEHGADLVDETPVTIVEPENDSDPYILRAIDGSCEIKAHRLVIAAGSWTNKTLEPLNYQMDLTVWTMALAFWEVEKDWQGVDFPMWYEFGKTAEEQYYGFPQIEWEGKTVIKTTSDFPAYKSAEPLSKEERQPSSQGVQDRLNDVRTFLQKRFKGIKTGDAITAEYPLNQTTCLYAMSKDGEMILGRLPKHDRITIFAGDSGRAFKFGPLLGRIIHQISQDGETSYDISKWTFEGREIFTKTPE